MKGHCIRLAVRRAVLFEPPVDDCYMLRKTLAALIDLIQRRSSGVAAVNRKSKLVNLRGASVGSSATNIARDWIIVWWSIVAMLFFAIRNIRTMRTAVVKSFLSCLIFLRRTLISNASYWAAPALPLKQSLHCCGYGSGGSSCEIALLTYNGRKSSMRCLSSLFPFCLLRLSSKYMQTLLSGSISLGVLFRSQLWMFGSLPLDVKPSSSLCTI